MKIRSYHFVTAIVMFLVSCGNPVLFSTKDLQVISPSNSNQIQEIARLGKGWAHGIDISSDGAKLAVASSIGVYIYDLKTLELKRYIDTGEWIQKVYFSPNNKVIASKTWTEDRDTVRLWDSDTGKLLLALDSGVDGLTFSPDGNIIATTHQTEVRLWDAETGSLLKTMKLPSNYAPNIVFTSDGSFLATPYGLLSLTRGDFAVRYHTSLTVGMAIALSPDGQIVALTDTQKNTGVIKLVDTATGKELRVLNGQSLTVWDMAFSPDGELLASGSDDGKLRIWNVTTGKLLNTIEAHLDWAYNVRFTPDGKELVSSDWDAAVYFWDVEKGKMRRALGGHTPAISDISFNASERSLISGNINDSSNTSGLGTIRFWDLETEKITQIYKEPMKSFAISPDKKWLAIGGNYPNTTIQLVDIKTGSVVREFEGNKYSVNSLAFSPDGQILASGGEDYIGRLWDVSTGTLLHTLTGHGLSISDVTFSPNGKILATAGGHDQSIRLWDVESGKLLSTFHASGDLYQIAFSPDGKKLAAGSWEIILIWDIETGNVINLRGFKMAAESVAFSPDGRLLASGGWDKVLRIWNIENGQILNELKGHRGDITKIIFNRAGNLLISGSEDGTMRLWGVKSSLIVR